MTKNDLIDWVRLHGCEIEPLPEYKAQVLFIRNPEKPGARAYINLPIDDKELNHIAVYRVCVKLEIPYPDYLDYLKNFDDRFDD
jgi:hypothetical protein